MLNERRPLCVWTNRVALGITSPWFWGNWHTCFPEHLDSHLKIHRLSTNYSVLGFVNLQITHQNSSIFFLVFVRTNVFSRGILCYSARKADLTTSSLRAVHIYSWRCQDLSCQRSYLKRGDELSAPDCCQFDHASKRKTSTCGFVHGLVDEELFLVVGETKRHVNWGSIRFGRTKQRKDKRIDNNRMFTRGMSLCAVLSNGKRQYEVPSY